MTDAGNTAVLEREAPINFLEMSDEDMMKAPVPDFTGTTLATTVVDDPIDDVVVKVEKPPKSVVPAATVAEAEPKATGDVVKIEDKIEKVNEVDPVIKAEDAPKTEDATVDYEAEYKRLLAPFKANGRDIAPKSIDDAISLMQMGANYNKKMAALKPNLKLMKLLENNGMLSEEKISYLIDLERKSPEAINKLVKDSGLNPMDFDAEKAGEYRPKIHSVDDREIDLDTVLDEISGTPSYNRTLEIVSKEWDGPSKQAIAGAPQLLRVINDHVERGIYDVIHTEMDRERMFGRLNGLSDIEAYRQIGDAIQARGGFNHLGNANNSAQGKLTAVAPVIVIPKPKIEDDKLNDKRRAASSTKASAPSTANKDFNPLGMSDAEFMKLAAIR